jgi:hypothetical protein
LLGKPAMGVGVGDSEQVDTSEDRGFPQHDAVPERSTAHVVPQPTETDFTPDPRASRRTATGAASSCAPVTPSAPQPLEPQHQSEPSLFTMQAASPWELLESTVAPVHHVVGFLPGLPAAFPPQPTARQSANTPTLATRRRPMKIDPWRFICVAYHMQTDLSGAGILCCRGLQTRAEDIWPG